MTKCRRTIGVWNLAFQTNGACYCFYESWPTTGHGINWIYIDGTDARSEGNFVSTVTGAPLWYTNWHSHEPNNWDNDEDCVNMYAHINGTFNDNKCNKPLPAICERRKIYGTYMWHIHVFICVVYARLLALTRSVSCFDMLCQRPLIS